MPKQMKKLFFFVMALIAIASCSSDEVAPNTPAQQDNDFTTKVYIQGKDLSQSFARNMDFTSTESGHFYLRIDNRIPGAAPFDGKLYFPQTKNGQTVRSTLNQGLVDLNCPYFKYLNSITPLYVFDTKGESTMKAIASIPELKDILGANENHAYDEAINKILECDTLKVIWYVVKKERNLWHIDGVLTGKSTKDADDVPGFDKEPGMEETEIPSVKGGNVEVDIHQQDHKDWNEIKTSIHIRDYVETTTVEIPLGKEYWTEADDFAIREYKLYINGSELPADAPVKVTVEHKDDKLVITATITDENYLKELLDKYNDGVTIEVHSYPVGISQDKVWEAIKNAKVTTSKETILKVNKSSAFFSE